MVCRKCRTCKCSQVTVRNVAGRGREMYFVKLTYNSPSTMSVCLWQNATTTRGEVEEENVKLDFGEVITWLVFVTCTLINPYQQVSNQIKFDATQFGCIPFIRLSKNLLVSALRKQKTMHLLNDVNLEYYVLTNLPTKNECPHYTTKISKQLVKTCVLGYITFDSNIKPYKIHHKMQ